MLRRTMSCLANYITGSSLDTPQKQKLKRSATELSLQRDSIDFTLDAEKSEFQGLRAKRTKLHRKLAKFDEASVVHAAIPLQLLVSSRSTVQALFTALSHSENLIVAWNTFFQAYWEFLGLSIPYSCLRSTTRDFFVSSVLIDAITAILPSATALASAFPNAAPTASTFSQYQASTFHDETVSDIIHRLKQDIKLPSIPEWETHARDLVSGITCLHFGIWMLRDDGVRLETSQKGDCVDARMHRIVCSINDDEEDETDGVIVASLFPRIVRGDDVLTREFVLK